MQRSYSEINEKILSKKVSALTANEAKAYIAENGLKKFQSEIDIVVCSTFEMHTSALLYLNFGQTDPLIYFSEVEINDVKAYPASPTDLVLSGISMSESNFKYGGANVIEELVKGNDVNLKVKGKSVEVFPSKDFETWFNLSDLNSAKLILNQAICQNSIVAANSGEQDINSNMGTLIGRLENSTYNSSSFLNPLINDPSCRTIGIGTNIWIAGAKGNIIGEGSNSNPKQKVNEKGIPVGPAITLSAYADPREMDSRWIRGGNIAGYGPVLYVGIGVPIPVLNEEVAEALAITDDNIHTTIVDYSIPRRTKPTFGQCTYKELRTSTVVINEKPTLTSSLSSMAGAIEISNTLKESILDSKFLLSEPISKINMDSEVKKMDSRLSRDKK